MVNFEGGDGMYEPTESQAVLEGAPSLLSAVLIQIYFSHLATEANLNTLRKQRVFELHLVLLLRSGVVWVCCMGQVEQGHINHCISGTKNFL